MLPFFIAVTFHPQTGHEQEGRRPALVVSNTLFNEKTGLAFVCPLTGTDRGYPFHVAVTGNPRVKGFVMVEQVKSIDNRTRKIPCVVSVNDVGFIHVHHCRDSDLRSDGRQALERRRTYGVFALARRESRGR
ncbi:MAG: type II toxin-antitoxin system PemK/MazF family toxin [Bacteroidetes bacterium]|nr:type II toxin-antitoxin system PemK/MazF family toxin [Bacteroidota bacterium]